MIRVAMISRWHVHYSIFTEELMSMKNAKISVVWDEDPDKGKEWARKIKVDFEPNYDLLLQREDVDALVMSAPNTLHLELMTKAARAGKHIFTEKVLAPTLKEAMVIAKEVEKSRIKFCINVYYETYPHILYAKKLLESGALGAITSMRYRVGHAGMLVKPPFVPEYFFDVTQSGGGSMIDIGAHPMNMLVWFLGRPKAVTSLFNSYCGRPLEDNAVSIVEFQNKAVAVAEASFLTCQNRIDVLELYGTKGILLLNVFQDENENSRVEAKLYLEEKKKMNGGWTYPDRFPDKLPSILSQWVRAVDENLSVGYGMDQALQLTEMMDAAYRSHREKRKVDFLELN